MSITNKNHLGNKLNMISIVLLLLFVSYTKEDLPVHCVLSDIVGSWKFMIDKHSFTPSLKNEQTTCGHGFPNKVVYGENEQDGENVITILVKGDTEDKNVAYQIIVNKSVENQEET